jgi:4-amino-4-deoxy-L-arabinose transferase-like glycosyltransferase
MVMFPSVRASTVLICLAVIGGYFLALFLSYNVHYFGKSPRPITVPGEWISSNERLGRGYFRQVVDVPFYPEQAWVGVASDSYVLYVNGRKVIGNLSALNSANAFQNRASDQRQGFNMQVTQKARAPVGRRGPNREGKVMLFADVTQYLRNGSNVFALEVLSASEETSFMFMGSVRGQGRTLTFDSSPEAWTTASLPQNIGRDRWYDSGSSVDGWQRAVGLRSHKPPPVALVPPELWSMPLPTVGATGPQIGGTVRLHLNLPAARRGTEAWLRVHGSWPYFLFLNGRLLEQQRAGATTVYDISRYITGHDDTLAVRLTAPTGGAMDAPVLMVDGLMGSTTWDSTGRWSALVEDHARWVQGEGRWVGASQLPAPSGFRPVSLAASRATWDQAAEMLVLWLGSALAIAGAALALAGFLWLRGPRQQAPPLRSAMAVIVVPTLVCGLLVLLRLRFKETDALLTFLSPDAQWFQLMVVAGVSAVAFLLLAGLQHPAAGLPAKASRVRQVPDVTIVLLALIVLIAGYLRLRGLGFEDLQADENVSFDAARGILRTGVPEAVSGVLYTRSPLYHYLLAGWLWMFGDTATIARGFSTLPGTAVVVVAYWLTRRMGGSKLVALLVALWLAVDPWQIHVSRNIRFYQQMQLLGCLSFGFFLNGFILGRDRREQRLFFLAAGCALLSQEVFVIVLPGLCIAGYLYYRPFDLWKDREVVFLTALVMAITIVNITVFTVYCLTPHVGVATSSGSILQFHMFDVSYFFNTFFSGQLRANFLPTILFFAGLLFWIRRPSPAIVFAYVVVLATTVVATVLVVQVASRYLFVIYPLFISTTGITLQRVPAEAAKWFWSGNGQWTVPLRRRWAGLIYVALLVTGGLSAETWRLLDSYDERVTFEHESAYRFIAEHKRPDDRVISVSPMAAATVLGKLDYYLMENIAFDEVYLTETGIIDRWSGGKLLSGVDAVREVFLNHERVWIVIDRAGRRQISGQLQNFIEESTDPAFPFFGGEVRLWKHGSGRLLHVPDHGGANASF